MMQLLRFGCLNCLIAFLLMGCGSQRELTAPIPSWVLERPVVPGYYLGIASVTKSQYPYNGPETAQKRALSALASEISVKVEATSVLNTLQRDARVSQQFTEDIRSSSEEDLEGYELVAVYESGEEYWAYYRLHKATYDRIKSERKQAAIAVAAGFYEAGLEAESQRDVGSALDRFVRGLNALEKHWGEVNLWQNSSGTQIAVDQACLIGLNRVLNDLRLESLEREINLSFASHYRGELMVQALLNGGAVMNLPLIGHYSRGTLPHKKSVRTNGDGMAPIVLEGFDAGLIHSEVRVEIDMDALLPDLPGLAVQALIEGLEAPELVVSIRLDQPVVHVSGREYAFGSPSNELALQRSLASALSERGLRITESESDADLFIELEANTSQGGQAQGFHTALLTATVRLLAQNGEVILQKNLERVKGVQLNWNGASQAAYAKAGMEIRGSFLQEMMESLYQ